MRLSCNVLIYSSPCEVFVYCSRMRGGGRKVIVVLTCPHCAFRLFLLANLQKKRLEDDYPGMYLSILLSILATPCGGLVYCNRMRGGGKKMIVVLACCPFLEADFQKFREEGDQHVMYCMSVLLLILATPSRGFVYCSRKEEEAIGDDCSPHLHVLCASCPFLVEDLSQRPKGDCPSLPHPTHSTQENKHSGSVYRLPNSIYVNTLISLENWQALYKWICLSCIKINPTRLFSTI